jgi:hypothetical protein
VAQRARRVTRVTFWGVMDAKMDLCF